MKTQTTTILNTPLHFPYKELNMQTAHPVSTDNYTQRIIDTLTITAIIKNENWSGTDDIIYISLGHQNQTQLLCDAPRVGQKISIKIDINKMFGRPTISLSEIKSISISQVPHILTTTSALLSSWTFHAPKTHPIADDDWQLESVLITANDIFTNTSFKQVNKWLGNPTEHLQQVWSGRVHFSDWKNSDNRPIDLNAQTYPIRWMPYIADIVRWRCYDPAKIDGVGQLVGLWDGKIIGNQLKNRTSEILSPNDTNNSYTWVFTPEGSIIYRRWEHGDRDNYVRHSQLGSGRPVICAGELKVIENRLDHVIALVNDASGHYRPDGGACLRYVAEKFESLGISTAHTEWKWRSANS